MQVFPNPEQIFGLGLLQVCVLGLALQPHPVAEATRQGVETLPENP